MALPKNSGVMAKSSSGVMYFAHSTTLNKPPVMYLFDIMLKNLHSFKHLMEKDRRYSPTVFLVGLLVFSLLSVPVTQAEGPDNVQFVGLNALTYSGVDDSGELSSNLTVRQGDHLNLEIPVENTGVDAEIASVVLHVNQKPWNETVYFDLYLIHI